MSGTLTANALTPKTLAKHVAAIAGQNDAGTGPARKQRLPTARRRGQAPAPAPARRTRSSRLWGTLVGCGAAARGASGEACRIDMAPGGVVRLATILHYATSASRSRHPRW